LSSHYDVLIATPGSSLESGYVKSLTKTLTECHNKNISYLWLNASSSLVHHARELTISGSENLSLNPDDTAPVGGRVTYNKIIWIDSDIIWEPEDFFKIYYSEYDVVSGVYLLADGITSSVHDKNGEIQGNRFRFLSEPFQVQSIGFGFVAMKNGVFEKIERPWFKHVDQKIKRSDGTEIVDSLGEDISWCVKAYNVGIPIYCDPSVLVGHTKKNVVGFKLGQIRQFQ
jgi:hypothetical protein